MPGGVSGEVRSGVRCSQVFASQHPFTTSPLKQDTDIKIVSGTGARGGWQAGHFRPRWAARLPAVLYPLACTEGKKGLGSKESQHGCVQQLNVLC